MKKSNKQRSIASVALMCLMILTSCKMVSQEPASKEIIISKNAKWSEKMALTLMKRHERSYMIDDSKAPKWDYVHGLVLHSIEELNKVHPDPRYVAYVRDYVDTLVDKDGNIKTYEIEKYNIDMVVAGRLLFDLYKTSKDNRYLVALQTLKKQLEGQPRTTSGGFWHKKIYPNQMWLDGLYMAEPFYAEYATLMKKDAAFDDIANQFIWMEKKCQRFKNRFTLPRMG